MINTPTRGLGDKSLDKVVEIASREGITMLEALVRAVDTKLLSKKAASAAEGFLRLYGQLVELSKGSLVELLQHLLAATNYLEYLAKKKAAEPDESVDENVNELLADARQIDETSEPGKSLETLLEQVSLQSDTDGLDTAADRVTLMTLHSAKGLEFPHVFIIAVEQDLLPHARSMSDPQQLEEERRLFFVGITRAKDRLQLSTAARRGFQNRTSVPSPFLMEIPRLELEITDYGDESYGRDDFDRDFDDDHGAYRIDDSEFLSESRPTYTRSKSQLAKSIRTVRVWLRSPTRRESKSISFQSESACTIHAMVRDRSFRSRATVPNAAPW